MKKLSNAQMANLTGGGAYAVGLVGAMGSGAIAGAFCPVPGGMLIGAAGGGISYVIARVLMR